MPPISVASVVLSFGVAASVGIFFGYYPARLQSYLVGYNSGRNGADVNSRLLTDLPANDGNVRLLSSGNGVLAGAGWGRSEIEYDDVTGSVQWRFPEGTAIGLAALPVVLAMALATRAELVVSLGLGVLTVGSVWRSRSDSSVPRPLRRALVAGAALCALLGLVWRTPSEV